MEASIVITTRNRREELLGCIASCVMQDVPVEILVLDDASTDGTVEALRQRFPARDYPQMRIFRCEHQVGYIVLRNRGARLARTPVIVSIDDDARFTGKGTVRKVLEELAHPRVGAVAIPFRNIHENGELRQCAPADGEVYLTAQFVGTAHAVRRELFLELGGYRECLVHQGEEADLCVRMLERGYGVRLGRGEEIHHLVSPRRDMGRLHYYGGRNNLLFAWLNVPWSLLPAYLAVTAGKTLAHGWRVGAFGLKCRAVAAGLIAGWRLRGERRAVSRRTLRLFRALRRGPLPLTRIEPRLPQGHPGRGKAVKAAGTV